MSEQHVSGQPVDSGGVSDEVSFVVRNEEGEATQVKGPDPKVWGRDEDRPVSAAEMDDSLYLDYGEVVNEGTPEQVKGPDESWRQRHANPEGETSEG